MELPFLRRAIRELRQRCKKEQQADEQLHKDLQQQPDQTESDQIKPNQTS